MIVSDWTSHKNVRILTIEFEGNSKALKSSFIILIADAFNSKVQVFIPPSYFLNMPNSA